MEPFLKDTLNEIRNSCFMKMKGWLVHRPGFVPHSRTGAPRKPGLLAVQCNFRASAENLQPETEIVHKVATVSEELKSMSKKKKFAGQAVSVT